MKIQRLRLPHTVMARVNVTPGLACWFTQTKISIHLISGRKKDKRLVPGPACRVKDVECSAQVHFEVEPWVNNGSRHRNLGGKMIDFGGSSNRAFNQCPVANVTNCDAQAIRITRDFFQPIEIMLDTAANQTVKDMHVR